MPRQTSVQLTEATERQAAALKGAGFGSLTDIIRIAIDRMYREEIKMDTHKYNLSSNMAHRINFDQMVERTLADALEAYQSVGHWSNYFDLSQLDVDDEDEAKARIEAIWPEVEEGEEYRKPAGVNTEWHEILGNHISAEETYQVYVSERTEGETLAEWITRKNEELWGSERNDISAIVNRLAADLERAATPA